MRARDEAEHDAMADLWSAARAALRWMAAGMLAASFASAGILAWVLLTEPAAAEKRIELLGGGCRLTATGDGVWHNSNYPHDVSNRTMTSGCYQAGLSEVTRRSARTSYGWRLAYVDFGTVRWRGVYPLLDAEQFTLVPDGRSCDYPRSLHGCVGSATHRQRERGISLGRFGERRYGPVDLGLELGAFLYYGEFAYRLESWPDPSVIRASTADHMKGWQLTPYVGATARYGFLFAQFRVYASVKAAKHGCGDCSGVSAGSGRQLLVGYSWSLE